MRRLILPAIALVACAGASAAVAARLVTVLTFPVAGADEPRSALVVKDFVKPGHAVRFAERGIRYEARLLLVERTAVTPGPFSAARPGRTVIVTRLELSAPGAPASVPLPEVIAQAWVRNDQRCGPGGRYHQATRGDLFGAESNGTLTYQLYSDGRIRSATQRIPRDGSVVEESSGEVAAGTRACGLQLYLDGDRRGLRGRDRRLRLSAPAAAAR